MKYYSAIFSLFVFTLLAIISLLYFSNITRNIEKQNYTLKDQIKFIEDQININEIEYSLYNSYEYLSKLKKIYFEEINLTKEYKFQRIKYTDFKSKNLDNFYTVAIE